MDNAIATQHEREQFMYNCQNNPVFFVENVLNDEYGEPYILEEYQKEYLLCPARYKVLFWARRLSKSLMMKFELLHKTVFNRSFKSMIVSPSWDQSLQFGEDIQDIIDATPDIQGMFESKKATKMKLVNNSKIYLVSAGRGGISQLGKGVRYLGFDETQQIPEEAFLFLRPTLLGQKKGTERFLVYAGTPLGRIGTFYDTYMKGRYYIKMDGIYENPDAEGSYVVFERPTAVMDGDEVVGTGTERVTIEELEQEWRDLPKVGFLREYCLKFLDQIGEVFSQELLKRVTDRNMAAKDRAEGKIVMGLDLGKQRYNSVLTVGKLFKGEKIKIINVVKYDLGTEYHDIADRVLEYRDKYPGAIDLRIDETGVGKGVIEIFRRKFNKNWQSIRVTPFDFSGPKKKLQLVEAGVNMLENGSVKMVYNQEQQNEMLEFRREISDKGNILYRKPQGGSDDYVDSLLLTLLSARDHFERDDSAEIAEVRQNILQQSALKLRQIKV
jgi:hypothetical protein